MRSIHPGEVSREEFLQPLGMSAHALAMAIQVPAPRINDVVRERRVVTVGTVLHLAKYFGNSMEFCSTVGRSRAPVKAPNCKLGWYVCRSS